MVYAVSKKVKDAASSNIEGNQLTGSSAIDSASPKVTSTGP